MNKAEFERLVSEALDSLPPHFREKLSNVAVVVEWWPTPAELRQAGLHPSGMLFGLYQGVPLTQRGRGYNLVPPDRIVIYQGPIEIYHRRPEAIREQVRRTVMHEIAHHFGISDERLHELGV
ncbi:MAG: metallopeptidase family protein [Chloroflexi bacterium]|nr:metallopeptidase family protein [Chloroflexota bacterium]